MVSIKLNNGFETIVDDIDYEAASKIHWYAWRTRSRRHPKPYARHNIKVNGKHHGTILLHDLIVERMGLKKTEGLFVDHIDGDSLNNTRINLRLVTNTQNQANRHVISKRSKLNQSKYKGVFWNKRANKWEAGIGFTNNDGVKKKIYLGVFDKEEDAARAYNVKAVELFGEHACPNEIKK